MDHHTPLLATIAVGFLVAFAFGLIATRLRMPAIVGYLLAGVLVGPFTPGFTADTGLAAELAEIGVILLMFGVGLHFSYRDLFAVRHIAVPGAIAQIAVATGLGVGLASLLGWPLAGGLIFGLSLSVASTVVLLRALEERQLIDTRSGHIAIGWLIVEDLAMVVALVVLPALASAMGPTTGGGGAAPNLALSLLATFGKVVAFVALMFIVGRRVIPWLLARVAGVGSRELFTLAVLAIGVGIAYGAAVLFDVSFALGAFFAGMILKESELSHRAADDTLPLRDAFAVLFFVSVGMLLNPAVLIEQPLAVLATVAIIVIGKSLAAFIIVKAFRYPGDTALLISASLAQIGEFSFILVTLGVGMGVLPAEGRDLVLAGAIISILINPAAFALAGRLRAARLRRLEAKTEGDPAPEAALDVAQPHTADFSDHVVIVGYGRVGRRVAEALDAQGIRNVILELDPDRVEDLRRGGHSALLGNATRAEVLKAANVSQARSLLIAAPDGFEAGEIAARARKMNADLRIVARAHLDSEVQHVLANGADRAIMGEQEIARLMVQDVSSPRAGAPDAA